MADIVDQTQDREEYQAPALLRSCKKPEGPVAAGYCHWCSAEFAKDSLLRFCDTNCRDDFQNDQTSKQRAGKANNS